VCLIAFAYKLHPRYPLIFLGNRDEFHARPTRAAQFWPEAPDLLAGKDLQAGGSWLGVNRQGYLAAVTNFREPAIPPGPRSRGELVTDYLLTQQGQREVFYQSIKDQLHEYSGFNLLLGRFDDLHYLSNRHPSNQPVALTPGLYGLSNHLLDTPWPKLTRLKQALEHRLAESKPDPEALLALLQDTTKASDAELPDTGVGLANERFLSSAFIVSPVYGTRASSLILVSQDHTLTFVEQNYAPSGSPTGRQQFQLRAE